MNDFRVPQQRSLHTPSGSNESLMLFMPMHNEGLNVFTVGEEACRALGSLSLKAELLLVNDGSTDNTLEEGTRLMDAYSGIVKIVSHDKNKGYGGALRTGLKAGLESGASLIAVMDGDGQFDPYDLNLLVQKMNLGKHSSRQPDAVFGIRQQRSEGLYRQMMGEGWRRISSSVLGCDVVSDVDCGMKLFRSTSIEKIVPQLISNNGAAISPEIVVRMKRENATFAEVPVTHRPRLGGESSGGNFSVALQSVKDLLTIRKELNNACAQ